MRILLILEPSSVNLDKPQWGLLLGLGLVGLVLFFSQLGWAPLMDPDEGRYAEIAREMLAARDWLIPRLNHLPYL